MKYYCIYNRDGDGNYPIINLNRYDCDVYLRVDETKDEISGFVYCRHSHTRVDKQYWLERYKAGELGNKEISEEEYLSAWRDFCNL